MGWLARGLPCSWGPQACDVLSFASAGPQATRPSQRANNGGGGVLLALVPSRAKRFQLQPFQGQPERGGSRAGWVGRPPHVGPGPARRIC